MSDAPPPQLVLNLRDQPVELLLPGGVVVVPPRGHVEVGGEDASSPQLQALVQRRLIAIRPVPRPAEPEAEEPAPDTEASPAPKRRRRS